MRQQISLQKSQIVEEVKNLLNEYRVLGIASLEKVRAAQLHELRRKLKGSVHMKVFKNSLFKKAVAGLRDKPKLKALEELLSGPNIFLFTDLNPFKLALLLRRSRVKAFAKAGDVATYDVIAPAGNTGLPPGPIISQLHAVGLSTKVESGSVWIVKEKVLVKKEEVISEQLASVLSKLGLKAIEVGLSLKAAFDEGVMIKGDELELDLDGIRKGLNEAQRCAFNLSLNAAYPIPENVALLIQRAHKEARSLAIRAVVPIRETIVDLIKRAYAEALSVSDLITKG